MSEKFELTEEHILNAVDYIPLAQKVVMADVIAKSCISNLIVKKQEQKLNRETRRKLKIDKQTETNDLEEIKLLCEVVNFNVELFSIAILVKHYFKFIDKESEIDVNFSPKQYDYYMGGHIINQLKRYAKGFLHSEIIVDKAQNILFDYYKFIEILNTEIQKLINKENDMVSRLVEIISQQSSPEYIEKATAELVKAQEELKEFEPQAYIDDDKFNYGKNNTSEKK